MNILQILKNIKVDFDTAITTAQFNGNRYDVILATILQPKSSDKMTQKEGYNKVAVGIN